MSTLKFDYDSKWKQKRLVMSRMAWVLKFLRVGIKHVSVCKTIDPITKKTRGYHVKIETKQEIKPLMRIMIQSLCNSDYARETYNLVRALNLIDRRKKYSNTARDEWNVLYSMKEINDEKVSMEAFDEKLTGRLKKVLKKRRQKK